MTYGPLSDVLRHIRRIDAADREPGLGRARRRVAYQAEAHRRPSGLGGRLVHRPDGVVVGVRALCGLDLIRVAEPVRLSATPSWLRLETKLGAVVARRVAQLPLVGVG